MHSSRRRCTLEVNFGTAEAKRFLSCIEFRYMSILKRTTIFSISLWKVKRREKKQELLDFALQIDQLKGFSILSIKLTHFY